MYDVYEIRKQFPMLNGEIKMQGKPLVFLDNASTTFKPKCVIDAINLYLTKMTSNSHRGDYDLLFAVDTEVDKVRNKVGKFINCDTNEVVFTSGATMALNLLAQGYGKSHLKRGDEIVIDESEHASNVLPWFKVAKETGAIVRMVELSEKGEITLQNLKKVLNSHTKIVSLACITNVMGYKINLKEFAHEVHKVGAIFAVDGAQSVPHIKTDFKDSDIDFLAFSAHKMCGPTGLGCLIGKYDLLCEMDPMILGGGDNITFSKDCSYELYNPPRCFESGTLAIEQIFGLGAAIDFLNELGMDNIEAHEKMIREYAISELSKLPNIIIYNKEAVGPIAFDVKGVFSQDEATLLNSKGIAVRSGQHCAKMLNNFLNTPSTCRCSTYLYTTKEEIDALVDALKNGGDILDAYFN